MNIKKIISRTMALFVVFLQSSVVFSDGMDEALPIMPYSVLARVEGGADYFDYTIAKQYYSDTAPVPVVPVPIVVGDILIFVYSEVEWLAKDPGQIGRDTLYGVDADNDLVRDDLERYIAYKYPHDRLLRASLYRIAEYAINGLATSVSTLGVEWVYNENSPEGYADFIAEPARIEIHSRQFKSCLLKYRKTQQDGNEIYYDLLAEIFNTYERAQHMVKLAAIPTGKIFGSRGCSSKAWFELPVNVNKAN